jgi:hypothetical protein
MFRWQSVPRDTTCIAATNPRRCAERGSRHDRESVSGATEHCHAGEKPHDRARRGVGADTPVREVARKMRDKGIGCLPVGEHDMLIGMITDRDIACRAVADGLDLSKVKARDVMSKGVTWCFEDQSDAEATKLMESKNIRHLPFSAAQSGSWECCHLAISPFDPNRLRRSCFTWPRAMPRVTEKSNRRIKSRCVK